MTPVIKLKRKSGAFTSGDLAAGELAVDVKNNNLCYSTDGKDVHVIESTSFISDKEAELMNTKIYPPLNSFKEGIFEGIFILK